MDTHIKPTDDLFLILCRRGVAHARRIGAAQPARHRIIEYLIEAGGAPTEALSVEGDGWSARLDALEPAQLGAMSIPRDLLVIEGDDDAVAPVREFMERKTMRGGG
jgi:hypothetical protein